jgi:hypothetical protein
MTTPDPVQIRFGQAMWQIYEDAKQLGYVAAYFARMLNERGAINTARKLINDVGTSDGFTKLWELQRLDLSVEAVALRPEFRGLFTSDELNRCRLRLAEYGFTPKPEHR